MNSLWLVITALAAFLVAYRFYGAFLAAKVAVLDDRNVTPAHRLRDGVDYHPTRRLVLFGAHFAAIAGSGPLVGPVLASQWGYFPGFCWIVIGSCLAGGVHDFVVLLASVRRDGKSLAELARDFLSPAAGIAATAATLLIIVTTLAATAKVVVNALNESAWGMFAVAATIPAALLTGFWMNKIRPGRVGEASLIGVSLVVLGVIAGQFFDNSAYRGWLVYTPKQLSLILAVYAAVVSILPVWVLLVPRGYLTAYMKVSVIALLGVGILIAQPTLKMPALTPFIHGGGPIPGSVLPFVCIVIACGALSGFHALIASGTTPRMVNKETDIRAIGYGAMLLEGIVSLTALIAACSLEPGDYFKINTATKAQYNQLVTTAKAENQWDLQPKEFDRLKADAGIKEELAGRTAGAVTLALGMAKVLADLPGVRSMMAYLYHFIVMFEVLFILTLLETGTARGPLHFAGGFGASCRPAERRPRNVLDAERDGQRWRLRDVGLSVVSFRVCRAVGDDGSRQPTACGHRTRHRHRVPADVRAEANLRPLHGDSVRSGHGDCLYGGHSECILVVAATRQPGDYRIRGGVLPHDVRVHLRDPGGRSRDRV